jgi:hypothetical protein
MAGSVQAFAAGEPGAVLAQFPKAGRAAAPDLTVKLVVGRG